MERVLQISAILYLFLSLIKYDRWYISPGIYLVIQTHLSILYSARFGIFILTYIDTHTYRDTYIYCFSWYSVGVSGKINRNRSVVMQVGAAIKVRGGYRWECECDSVWVRECKLVFACDWEESYVIFSNVSIFNGVKNCCVFKSGFMFLKLIFTFTFSLVLIYLHFHFRPRGILFINIFVH